MKKTEKKLSVALKILYLPIDSLIENPNNARTHSDKQIAKIARSIEEFGFTNPALIDQNKMTIAGHGRIRAAKLLGIKEIPTVVLEHLTQAQVKAYILADNQLALEAGWDHEILKIELQGLIELDFDVSLTGFEIPEIDFMVNYDPNKDEKPDKADVVPDKSHVPPRAKSGDIWKLGKSYLFCGNSLDENSFKYLLKDNKAAMIFTDPPYNVKIDANVCGSGKIKHEEFAMASGEMSKEEFINFLDSSLNNLVKYSTDGSIHYICMDWRHVFELMSSGNKVYSELKNICVWNKLQGGMGSLYRSQHELVFVFKNGTKSHVNNVELGKNGRYRTNVWDYKGVSATNPGSLEDLKLHPTVKPIALVMDAILDTSKPNDIILDCFAGSGTTLLAAERTHRKAYVIEYEPKYCDVIIYRYEKLFNKKAELISNSEEV